MMSPRQIVARGFLLGVFAAVIGAGAFFAYVAWYTGSDRILPGVTVGQTPVGGLTVGEARGRVNGDAVWRPPVLAGGPGAAGGTPIGGTGGFSPQRAPMREEPGTAALRWEEQTWSLSLDNVGPVADVGGALQQASLLGRKGTLWDRSWAFLQGLLHGHYVPVETHVREDAIARQLDLIARELNREPQDARYDFEQDQLMEDVEGRSLDVEASLAAVRQAVMLGRREVDLVVKRVPPAVRKHDLKEARRHLVARFTTPILAADPGRVHNIGMAVKKISGKVLQPGQVFSFNDIVGPRDAANGWAQAKELYQGEFVLGYGGGICQVSSTLYNSILLAGLEVKERYHHDRPLQYIAPGRDATVAWKVLDFKFRNNLNVPMIIGAQVLPGQPQQIEVTIHAPRPLSLGAIKLEESEVKYYPPEMVEVIDPTLPADAREVIDEGHYGIEVKTYRVFEAGTEKRRELVSHDRYLPKPGKVRVGVGNAPGTDKLLAPGLQ